MKSCQMARVQAFSLVELLVVITVVVVLLALIAPAMDKAIYQAELAMCGSNLHSISGAALTYAAANGRQYPYRKRLANNGGRAYDIQYANWGGAPPNGLDDRPMLRTLVNVNATLNCPAAPAKVDLDGSDADTNIIGSYGLWFGFKYAGQPGMMRLGQRWKRGVDEYNTLAGDWSGVFVGTNQIASHNDAAGGMFPQTFQDEGALKYTYSIWASGGEGARARGPLDLNFARDDASVSRHNAVRWDEGGASDTAGRFTLVPQWNDDRTPTSMLQVPAR